jgi:hypothetical protein
MMMNKSAFGQLKEGMISELPAYKAASHGLKLDRADVDKYTQALLEFWNTHTKDLPNWHIVR